MRTSHENMPWTERNRKRGKKTPLLREKWVFLHFLRRRGWEIQPGEISRMFYFRKNTDMAQFVSEAVRFVRTEGSRPKVIFGFRRCRFSLTTQMAGGVTEHDLFLACKVDALAGSSRTSLETETPRTLKF